MPRRESFPGVHSRCRDALIEDGPCAESNPIAISDTLRWRSLSLHALGSDNAADADLSKRAGNCGRSRMRLIARHVEAFVDAAEGEILVVRKPERAAATLERAIAYFERPSPLHVPRLRLLLARAQLGRGLDEAAEKRAHSRHRAVGVAAPRTPADRPASGVLRRSRAVVRRHGYSSTRQASGSTPSRLVRRARSGEATRRRAPLAPRLERDAHWALGGHSSGTASTRGTASRVAGRRGTRLLPVSSDSPAVLGRDAPGPPLRRAVSVSREPQNPGRGLQHGAGEAGPRVPGARPRRAPLRGPGAAAHAVPAGAASRGCATRCGPTIRCFRQPLESTVRLLPRSRTFA